MCALVNNNKCQRRAKVTVAKGVGVGGGRWVVEGGMNPTADSESESEAVF